MFSCFAFVFVFGTNKLPFAFEEVKTFASDILILYYLINNIKTTLKLHNVRKH